jgi:hypothetical protein
MLKALWETKERDMTAATPFGHHDRPFAGTHEDHLHSHSTASVRDYSGGVCTPDELRSNMGRPVGPVIIYLPMSDKQLQPLEQTA